MFFGLFRSKPRVVTVKQKLKRKKAKTGRKKKTARAKNKKPLKKTSARSKTAASKAKSGRVAPQEIGKATHYFPHVKAGVIRITRGTITLEDRLYFKGHTTDFKQKVTSMQINNVPIKQAKAPQEIGILVKSRLRHNDTVYKL